MNRVNLLFALLLLISLSANAQQKKTASKIMAANTADAKMKSFVANLMSKMTIEEKIGQLNLLTPGGGCCNRCSSKYRC